jgi:hypothetical protein
MDAQLAAIYGTGQEVVEENDIEKTAAAELLIKLAEEEGVDLNQFSDEEVAGMISDLYGQGGIEHTAEDLEAQAQAELEAQQQTQVVDDESQEKFAEADFLGRVMAHSMVSELNEIEKQALSLAGAKEGLIGAGKAVGGAVSRAGKAVAGKAGAAAERVGKGGAELIGGKGSAARMNPVTAKRLGAGLLGAGALGTAGTAMGVKKLVSGKKEQTKEGSALEALAQQAAFEMAKEAGYIDEDGNALVEIQQPEQEKQASQLEQVVQQRALEICAEAGLPVEWNE